MIGVINGEEYFEFADMMVLCKVLERYADGYRSNTMFITDRQGKIKAIIRNGSFDFYPTLDEEVPYRVVGMNTERGAHFEKNEQLKLQYNPNINVDKSFVFVRADRPTKIEIQ